MIPTTILEFHAVSDYPFDLGQAPGSSIRGALYGALNRMYENNEPIYSRNDMDRNLITWLLRLEDEQTSGGKDVPRPIAVRPPLDIDNKQSEMSFALSFYGKARETIHPVLTAVWSGMGGLGIGKRRQTFQVDSITTVDPLTGQHNLLLDDAGNQIGELPAPPSAETYQRLATLLNAEQLNVEFLTPTRIVHHDQLCHTPIFRAWFQRLLERVRTISEVYTDEPLWIPFRDLLTIADNVSLVSDQTRWHEAWSGSRRDGMVKPVSGFVGQVQYAGDFRQLLPYLLLGQALQVGKNTIKGCGWYRIHYDWR